MRKEETVEKIKNQVGSNGKTGWPVAVRDRIAFPHSEELKVTDSNFGVTFLWTIRDSILPKLEKENLAIATNFYTPSGLVGMIRNILGNPFIKYIILLGEEYSSRAKTDQISDLTSANAIRAFFREGVNSERKINGFGNSVYFDKNIPLEKIELIRKNIILIDLNKEMPNATLDEKIKKANEIMKSTSKVDAFSEPQTFDYEIAKESFPYEGGPMIIHGKTIPDSWIKMINLINRFGRKNLMNANTDRWVKEINNMTVVIHDSQNMDLSLNPFLVPLTVEKIEAYKKEILSPLLPEGKAYTYGNKLRAYSHPSSEQIKNLVNSDEYKDFEFGKGSWVDANVLYKNNSCEIDQLQDMIDVLKRDPYSKAVVALTWHPADELMRKHKSSPCLIFIQAMIQDEKLNLTAMFRSHDMTQGWPENAYGMAAIQNEIAKGVGVNSGILTVISGSAQIYNNYYQQVEDMLKKYDKELMNCTDARGNYQIKLENEKIVLTLLHPETGIELEKIEGKSAYEIKDKISRYGIETSHAIYIGTELAIAEFAIKTKGKYEQDETFKTIGELVENKKEIKVLSEGKIGERPSWDESFMFKALLTSARSSCKHLQTGAIIVKDKRIIAEGYNGAPPGIVNCLERGCRKDEYKINFDNKGKSICRGVHAEINAMSQIARKDLIGATLYTIYLPCSSCAKSIAGSGITRVVYSKEYGEQNILTKEMFAEAGISLVKFNINYQKCIDIIQFLGTKLDN